MKLYITPERKDFMSSILTRNAVRQVLEMAVSTGADFAEVYAEHTKSNRCLLYTSHENKMGTAPVLKLVLTMSLPAMFSMLVQALYNIVDSIFVSRLGVNALAAVSLAFPIQTLLIACLLYTSLRRATRAWPRTSAPIPPRAASC